MSARSSSPASSRPAASTSATTSARSASTSRARTAASRRSSASSTCTRSRSPTTRPSCASALYDTAAILLAAGLDPERCILFRQSDVREHTELTWLLSAVTSHGDLNRMTQFKEKSAKQRELVSAALFFYPVLMAADVLAYRATEVPVGDDQRQHVELMREIARRFNERFGETLVVPELRIPEVGARIMDLQEPERKMSTTGGTEAGTVLVLDEPDAIRKKLGSAVTDSGREVRPRRRQARDHQPDRHPRGRPRRRAGRGRARVRGRRLRRLQEGRGRGGRRATWRRSASATPSCAPTRRRSRRPSPPAPRRRARSPRRRRRRARAHGLRPARASASTSGALVCGDASPSWISTSTSSPGRSTC